MGDTVSSNSYSNSSTARLCTGRHPEMDNNRVKELFSDDDDRDDDSIPLADDDPRDVIHESCISEERRRELEWRKKVDFESLDSIPCMLSVSQSEGVSHISDHMNRMCLEPDFSPDEQEEKARLISQVLELQNTLDDLTHRVDKVKEENIRLKSENSVLGQYIENLMQASQVFQAVSPKSRRRHKPQNLGTVIRCTAKAVRGAVGGDSK